MNFVETATYRDRFASDGHSVKATLGPVGRAHHTNTEGTMGEWDDPIDLAALQAEWRDLKSRLDYLINEAWSLLTQPELTENAFAIRQVRARSNEFATVTTYAEDPT